MNKITARNICEILPCGSEKSNIFLQPFIYNQTYSIKSHQSVYHYVGPKSFPYSVVFTCWISPVATSDPLEAGSFFFPGPNCILRLTPYMYYFSCLCDLQGWFCLMYLGANFLKRINVSFDPYFTSAHRYNIYFKMLSIINHDNVTISYLCGVIACVNALCHFQKAEPIMLVMTWESI